MRFAVRMWITIVLFLFPARLWSNECEPNSCISLAGNWKWRTAEVVPANAYDPSVTDKGWNVMSVPGNWFLQGHDLSGQVWMRRIVQVPSSRRGQRARITFEGVDYFADVWLNGAFVGSHEGYFQPFSFDVTKLLKFGEDNLLVVRVDSPNEEYGRAWPLHKRLIKGVLNHDDARPGGAWSERGQEGNTGGIWAPVYLQFSEELTIETVHAMVHPSDPTTLGEENRDWEADLTVQVENHHETEETIEVEASIQPEKMVPVGVSGGKGRKTFVVPPGVSSINLSLTSKCTQLWWTWDHGSPHLYDLRVRVLADSKELDLWRGQIGFRTVRFDSLAHQWFLNGHRLFLRGTNYVSTQWLSEMTAERYDFDLQLMKRANINAIRTQAHVEAKEFYSSCDREGLLVWQEFPLQWGYTDNGLLKLAAISQAEGMVSMLYNHPSIFAWSLHNEPPWDAPSIRYKSDGYEPAQNRLLDEELAATVESADPSRYTQVASGSTEHARFGWYSGSWQDFAKPTSQPLITEFGAEALPALPSLRKLFDENDVWPDSEIKWAKWEYHDFQRKESFDVAGIPPGKNIGEFIDSTQRYQSQLVRVAAESYRRQRFAPVSAIFQHTFVEDWPSIGWGIVDYFRNPKPGYDALADAYQPVLPSIVFEQTVWQQGSDLSLDLWAINDLWTDFPRSIFFCQLRNQDSLLQTRKIPIDLLADSGERIGALQQKQLKPGSYEVLVRIEDMQGNVLGRNSFEFRVLD